jgi:hypothetical protein
MQVRSVRLALFFMPSSIPGGMPSAETLTTSIFISHSPGWSSPDDALPHPARTSTAALRIS